MKLSLFGYNRKETDEYFSYLNETGAAQADQIADLKEKLAAVEKTLSGALPRPLLAFGHELVEPAGVATGRFVLIQEAQPVLVEDLEEFFPGDLLQSLLGLAEIDAQDARIVAPARALYPRRLAPALLHPPADVVRELP